MGGAAAIGALGSLGGAAIQAGSSAAAAAAARDWQKKLIIKGPTWQRQGYERAGINPLFAYGGGGGSVQGAVPMQHQISAPDFSGSVRSMAEGLRTSKTTKSNVGQAASNAAQAAESVETQKAQTALVRTQTSAQAYDAVLKSLQIPGAQNEANIDASDWGKYWREASRIPSLGSGVLRGLAGRAGPTSAKDLVNKMQGGGMDFLIDKAKKYFAPQYEKYNKGGDQPNRWGN